MSYFLPAKLFLAGLLISFASFLIPQSHSPSLGSTVAFQPVQAAPTFLSGAGVTSGATSLNVTAFTTRQLTPITTANIGGIGYATIDPGTTKEENVSFTGVTQNVNGTAVLTGVTRGLQDVYPYTASTTLAIQHSGGATVITSNSGAFYSQFNIAANTSTITGNWTFASSSLPSVSSDTPTSSFTTFNLIDKQYADNLSFAGVSNGNTSTKGIYQEATTAQIASSTATGSTGADLIVPNRNSCITASTTPCSVISSGTLDRSFIATGTNYLFNNQSFSSTTFLTIPVMPTSTVSTTLTNVASVGYVVNYAPQFLSSVSVATSVTSSTINIATSTFTLAQSGRVLVSVFGALLANTNAGNGIGCTQGIKIDGSTPSDFSGEQFAINSLSNQNTMNFPIGETYISSPLTAASHSVTLQANSNAANTGGTGCTTSLTFQVEYIGQ